MLCQNLTIFTQQIDDLKVEGFIITPATNRSGEIDFHLRYPPTTKQIIVHVDEERAADSPSDRMTCWAALVIRRPRRALSRLVFSRRWVIPGTKIEILAMCVSTQTDALSSD